MRRRPRRLLATLVASCSLMSFVEALALEPSDLCTGNPCRIAQSFLVSEDVLLDFGPATTLRFAPRVSAVLAPGVRLTIRAATIDLAQGSGARALGIGTGLRLEASMGYLRSDGRVVFKLRGADSLEFSAAGNADLDVAVDVRSRGEGTKGGDVTIEAGGALTLRGKINASGEASGASSAAGGRLWMVARGGSLSSSAKILVQSNSGPGGEIEMHSTGSMVIGGKLDLSARREPGAGGDVRLVSKGDLVIGGALRTRGRGESAPPSEESTTCGDGGDVWLDTEGRLTLSSLLDIRGGFNCAGGLVTIQAQQGVVLGTTATLDSLTAGAFASSGRVEIYALRSDISIEGKVRLRAVRGGALIAPAADGRIVGTSNAEVHASSTGGANADPGVIAMAADCGLRVDAGAILDVRSNDSLGLPGRGDVELSVERLGTLAIAGSVRAAGAVRLWHVDTSPPQLTGTFQPPPEIESRPSDPTACT